MVYIAKKYCKRTSICEIRILEYEAEIRRK